MSPTALVTMSPCPDENTLAQCAQGRGSPALEAHLDGCDTCRRAVAAAVAEHTLPTLPQSTELTPGQRIGRYEIERELGRGGMGVVYMARDITLDRHVALKLVHARRDEASQARLLREAQVMAKLAHPNVVPVFELGDWRGDLCLVMELVNGVTLEAWLKAEKHSRKDILQAFIQAGRGLAAAHAAGVVHRDFKPANVLVGIDGRVRVTDFGLSRPGTAQVVELPPMASPLVTREGTLLGTIVYMAPEQIDGQTATEQSDQFSFCVSLAEALSGQRPFHGDTWSQLAVSQAEKPVLSRWIPASIRSVLRRGLNRDPSKRFTSMTTMLNALERAQTIGWKSVAVTSVAAAAACAFIVAGQPLPHRVQSVRDAVAESFASQPPVDELVTVVEASRDLPAGTVLSMDMLIQRARARVNTTESIVTPDGVNFIIGQKLLVPVLAGDALLWTQFETTDVDANEAIKTNGPNTHTLAVLDAFVAHKDPMRRCVEAFRAKHPDHSGMVILNFKVAPTGVPFEINSEPSETNTGDLAKCLCEVVSTFRIAGLGNKPTETIRFPVKF